MRVRSTLAFAALSITFAASAHAAEVQHVVGRGHTIEAIANRYHVTAKSIIEANHLKDVKHLKVGDVLTIPGVTAPAPKAKDASASAKEPTPAKEGKGKTAKLDKSAPPHGHTPEPTTWAMKAKTPGVVHVKRLATTEELDVKFGSKDKVAPATSKAFEKMMRSPSGLAHPIEPRLINQLGVVSNHFGSRKIEVISGFRPFTPTQYTPHSNHNHGKAIDFRVVGVPNEAVRDFCRTLKNTGCGYYPNSVFVHMDVRDKSAFWIDYSKPGEPPRYNAPNVEADEGTSDVHDESHLAAPAPTDPLPESATETPSPLPAVPVVPAPTSLPSPATTAPATPAPTGPSLPAATPQSVIPTPRSAVPLPAASTPTPR